MNFIILCFLCFAIISIGILALKQNIESFTSKNFFLFTLFSVFWIFANFFSNYLKDPILVLLFNRFIFLTTTLLVYFLYLFSKGYPYNKNPLSKRETIVYPLIVVLVCLVSMSNYLVNGVHLKEGYSEVIFGNGIYLYMLNFMLFFIMFIINMVEKYRKAQGIEKTKLQYLFLGISIAATGAIVTDLILPVFLDIFFLSTLGPFFMLVFVSFTGISIVKHRLFGIRFIIGRLLNYIILVVVPYASFYIVVFIEESIWGDIYTRGAYLGGVFISAIFTIIYWLIKDSAHNFFLGKFIYNRYEPAYVINAFSKKISIELDLDSLLQITSSTLKQTLLVKGIGLVIFDKDNHKVVSQRIEGLSIGKAELKQRIEIILRYWEKDVSGNAIVKEELELMDAQLKLSDSREILNFMNEKYVDVIVPFDPQKGSLQGVLIIGKAVDESAFPAEEILFLHEFMLNASAAISRALLYTEIEHFNDILKEEVHKATEELNKKYDELEETYRKEKDMMDILGHELRTPLSTARNAFYQLSKLINTNEIDHKKVKRYSQIIDENIHREIRLLETMLTTTKLDNDKVNLVFREVDLNDVARQVVDAYKKEVKEKGLKLRTIFAQQNLIIRADQDRLFEVINNFISNAIKYTDSGEVIVETIENNGKAELKVSDTGQGIPKEYIQNLGKKFYRVNQHIAADENSLDAITRPGGTGLGLYVSFGLVKLMHGKVKVHSKVGKGSEFSIEFHLLNKK